MIKTDLGVVFYEVNKKKETPKLLKLRGKMKLNFLVLFLSHLQGKGRVSEKDQLVVKSEGKEEWSEAFEAILVFTDPGDFFEGTVPP